MMVKEELYNICSVMFSFQDTHDHQMAQAIKLSSHKHHISYNRCLKWPLYISWQKAYVKSRLEHAIRMVQESQVGLKLNVILQLLVTSAAGLH
jgi:hypothetical protein